MTALTDSILARHHAGLGEAEIASQTGVSRDVVRAILRKADIARPAHRTRAAARGENVADPGRADRLLRKF